MQWLHMMPYTEELKSAIKEIKMYDFRYPVVSNVTGKPYKSIDEISDMLAKHFT